MLIKLQKLYIILSSYLDTDSKEKRTFLQKLGDLFRADITWDPLTMDMKFSLSAFRK